MKQFKFPLALTSCVLAFSHSLAAAPTKMPMKRNDASKTASKPLNVAFLIYPGVEVLDLSGPLDVFSKANFLTSGAYNIYTVAPEKRPFASDAGLLMLSPRYSLENCPRPDILIVPGASEKVVRQLGANPKVAQWVKRNATPSQTVMSVCTGAFVLGSAGLLDGKNSTTHWVTLDSFQREFPKTRAFQGVKYIRDGNIVTAAGVSSGIDGALFLIQKFDGEKIAETVARVIQYRRNQPVYPDSVRARVVVTKPSASFRNAQKLASDYDPVCGMKVSANTPNTALYKGKLYGFCMSHCRDEFKKHPEKYIELGARN